MQRKQRKWKWSEKRKSSFLSLQLTQKCRILNTQYRYVDAYRSIAFGQDTSDLRSQIKEAGMNAQSGALDLVPGDPNDEMYLRQAEHLMKRGALQAAIIYLHQSLTMNPESKVRDRYCLASGQGAHNFLYFAVFLICDRAFDAHFKNGFGFSFE